MRLSSSFPNIHGRTGFTACTLSLNLFAYGSKRQLVTRFCTAVPSSQRSSFSTRSLGRVTYRTMANGTVPLSRGKFEGTQQEYVVLNSGHKMPLLGVGTALADDDAAEAAVRHAITKAGYRHVDTAGMYGNETGVGRGIKAAKREDLFLTTKLRNDSHGRVAEAIREQLERLGTDYVDLYLIHWPVTGRVKDGQLDPPTEGYVGLHIPALMENIAEQETWQEMERLVEQGLCRSIGVSNFSVKKLKEVQSHARIQPAVNQVELHAWHRNRRIVDYCRESGVQIQAYSPLGGLPMYEGDRPWNDPEVRAVAQKNGKSPYQVLLRWALEYGACVIPKSERRERIEENADVWDWQLSEADYARLSGLKTQVRMCHGEWFLEKSPYKSLDDLWDGEA